MSIEEWRPVVGWEGFYEVSSQGGVKSLDRFVPNRPGVTMHRRAHVLVLAQSKDGYLHVWLCRENIRYQYRVSRLVALTFHGPCPEGMECRHLDGDKLNNKPSNLAWGTRSENTYDKVRHGTHPMARKTHCKRGHEFSAENTLVHHGGRRCRTCSNSLKRDSRLAKKASA